jgi:hypothetical protein
MPNTTARCFAGTGVEPNESAFPSEDDSTYCNALSQRIPYRVRPRLTAVIAPRGSGERAMKRAPL